MQQEKVEIAEIFANNVSTNMYKRDGVWHSETAKENRVHERLTREANAQHTSNRGRSDAEYFRKFTIV